MKIGIIGAGSMGSVHAAGWVAAGAEVVGIVSAGGASAAALAARCGARAYASLEALLPDVDVIDLCVPTDLHAPMTLMAAAAGRHVVCEKPIALTPADARAMIVACDRAGVRLYVAHVVRFFAAYRAAARLLHEGAVGDLGVVRLHRLGSLPHGGMGWFVDERRSGGALLDLLVHDFDVARWFAGPIARVHARSVRSGAPDAAIECVQATLRFESGAIGFVEGGWVYPPGTFRTGFDVAGRQGVLEWSSDAPGSVTRHLPPATAAREAVARPAASDDPYGEQIAHVLHALRSGAPFDVTAYDAAAALDVAHAARASLAFGASVAPEAVIS
jgi:myo-inositol 2-dehydrogenase / D-chiro-inositol 1-dehydrogenase